MDWLIQLSLLIGVWVAIYGMDSWRREHVGKRRLELAEDALALFYEARDAISQIRHPLAFEEETAHITCTKDESPEQCEARRKASIVFVRYDQHRELFSRIYSLRYRFMAEIGVKEAEPFDEVREVVNRILVSGRMLARLWVPDYIRTQRGEERRVKNVEEHEAVVWDRLGEGDPLNPKIAKAIEDMESVCKNVICGKRSLHDILNRPLFGKRGP